MADIPQESIIGVDEQTPETAPHRITDEEYRERIDKAYEEEQKARDNAIRDAFEALLDALRAPYEENASTRYSFLITPVVTNNDTLFQVEIAS